MYGIFTYIWLIFMVNVGQYTIHGSYGYWLNSNNFSDKTHPRCRQEPPRCALVHDGSFCQDTHERWQGLLALRRLAMDLNSAAC